MARRYRNKKNKRAATSVDAGLSHGGSCATSLVRLKASPAYFDAAAECPLAVQTPESPDVAVLLLEHWGQVGELLQWFSRGLEGDAGAQLTFSPTLSKEQRALLHRAVDGALAHTLESFSAGVGAERCVAVVARGVAPRRELAPEQAAQAALLWCLAKHARLPTSRDEIAEQVAGGALAGELAALWAVGGEQQLHAQALCAAASAGDASAADAVARADPSLLQHSVPDLLGGGVLPLHLAAASGQLQVVRVLLDLGADVAALDGRGLSALQAAQRAEQCEAEAMLLAAGAIDPSADEGLPVGGGGSGGGAAAAEEEEREGEGEGAGGAGVDDARVALLSGEAAGAAAGVAEASPAGVAEAPCAAAAEDDAPAASRGGSGDGLRLPNAPPAAAGAASGGDGSAVACAAPAVAAIRSLALAVAEADAEEELAVATGAGSDGGALVPPSPATQGAACGRSDREGRLGGDADGCGEGEPSPPGVRDAAPQETCAAADGAKAALAPAKEVAVQAVVATAAAASAPPPPQRPPAAPVTAPGTEAPETPAQRQLQQPAWVGVASVEVSEQSAESSERSPDASELSDPEASEAAEGTGAASAAASASEPLAAPPPPPPVLSEIQAEPSFGLEPREASCAAGQAAAAPEPATTRSASWAAAVAAAERVRGAAEAAERALAAAVGAGGGIDGAARDLWHLWDDEGADTTAVWMLGVGAVAVAAVVANGSLRRLMRRLRC